MPNSPAARRIKATYLELLAKRPHGPITVTEIAQRAQVNRVTFYRLYETQEAVLLDVLDEFDHENEQLMSTINPDGTENEGAIRQMLEHHRRNMPMLRTVLRSDMAHVQVARMEKPIMASVVSEESMLASFYCAGIIRVICDWILGGCKEDVDELLAFLGTASSVMA